jgi:hypothetical protein
MTVGPGTSLRARCYALYGSSRRRRSWPAIRWHAESPRQAHVSVAASARLADVPAVHRGRRVAGGKNAMFAVTVGAHRRLRYAARHSRPVHALAIFVRHIAVAHAAGSGSAVRNAPDHATSTSCAALWHVEHSGAAALPFRSSSPWILRACSRAICWWQLAQTGLGIPAGWDIFRALCGR